MNLIERDNRAEVTFKKIEGDNLIVDIKVCEPYFRKCLELVDGEEKIVRRKFNGIVENNIIFLDKSNSLLLEKVNQLKEGDIVYLEYHIKKGVDSYNTENWQLLNILDEIDMIELSNKNCLFTQPVPERENIIQPRRISKNKKTSKKDIKIATLEEENAQLKLQVQLFQKQLEEKVNVD